MTLCVNQRIQMIFQISLSENFLFFFIILLFDLSLIFDIFLWLGRTFLFCRMTSGGYEKINLNIKTYISLCQNFFIKIRRLKSYFGVGFVKITTQSFTQTKANHCCKTAMRNSRSEFDLNQTIIALFKHFNFFFCKNIQLL